MRARGSLTMHGFGDASPVTIATSRNSGSRPAQGLVEFALVLPIFLIVMFGIIEFGWAIYGYSTVQHAANEGVRKAMVLARPASNYTGDSGNQTNTPLTSKSCTTSTIIGSVVCSTGLLPRNRLTASLSVPVSSQYNGGLGNVTMGTKVAVTVKYSYKPIIAFPLTNAFVMTGFATSQTQ
jgi:Flp pilus assembly protein TadG